MPIRSVQLEISCGRAIPLHGIGDVAICGAVGQWGSARTATFMIQRFVEFGPAESMKKAMVIFHELRWVDVMEKRPNTLVSMTNFHGIFLQSLFWRLIFFVYLHLFRFSVSDSHANFPYCSENRSVLNMIQKSDERSSTFEG